MLLFGLSKQMNIFYASMIFEISQFQVGSYIHDNTQINFSGKYEKVFTLKFCSQPPLLQDMSTMLRTNGHNSTSWSVWTWVPMTRSSTGPTSHSHKPASRYIFLFFFFNFFHFCFFVFFFFSMTRSSTEPTRYLLALKYSPQLLARSIQIVREIGLATELIEWNIHKSGAVLFKNFKITLFLW